VLVNCLLSIYIWLDGWEWWMVNHHSLERESFLWWRVESALCKFKLGWFCITLSFHSFCVCFVLFPWRQKAMDKKMFFKMCSHFDWLIELISHRSPPDRYNNNGR
jgi:hypothetical protein